MLYLIAIILGIILGIIAKGRFFNLLNTEFKKVWIILLAFAIEILAQILALKGYAFILKYSFIISGIKFCLLAIGFWFNRHYLGMLVIGAGCLMNALVMMVNGGKMPVDGNLLNAIVSDKALLRKLAQDGKHFIANETTKLAFLSDIIQPPGILGIAARIVSAGDLVVTAGLLLVVFEATAGRRLIFSKSKFSID